MISTLLGVNDAALHMIRFLPTADLFTLHAVNREWHTFLDEHEGKIFYRCLRKDFPAEGELLRRFVAKKYGIPKKKLYLAFAKRWVMPSPGGRDDRLCFPWIRPEGKKDKPKVDDSEGGKGVGDDTVENGKACAGDGSKSKGATDDPPEGSKKSAGNLGTIKEEDDVEGDRGIVFIGRVGDITRSLSCVALKMQDTDYSQTLVVDKEAMCRIPRVAKYCGEAEERVPRLLLPQDARACELLKDVKGYEGWQKEFDAAIRGSYDLTLHVIDVRTCQVMSLTIGGDSHTSFVYKWQDGGGGIVEPSYQYLNLYGVPPRYSPRHRVFTERDFRKLGDAPWEHDDYPPIDNMNVYAELKMVYVIADDGTVTVRAWADDLSLSLGGEFSSIRRPEDVCCFLRAIMKEKCARGEIDISTGSFPAYHEQHSWVQSNAILDAITQYSSFEDLAGTLRLVCREFQSSALRQLKQKMEKTKVVGFRGGCEFGDSWFKATVRQGWSEDCLTDKESVVDDALWLASCRCMFRHCKNKDSCPTASKPPKFSGYQVKAASLNMKWARNELAEKGRIQLTQTDPIDLEYDHDYFEPSNVVECSYEEKEMCIYRLCDEVEKIIEKRARTGYECEDEPLPLLGHLKRDYSVSKQITSRQFIRSLFLVFAKAKAAEVVGSEKEGREAPKKARLASVNEVRKGMAETRISGADSDSYYRTKKIYRFYSAAKEPMEICIESRGTYRY